MEDWWIWLLPCVGGAALVTATVSRRWVWEAGVLYFLSPLIVLPGWLVWESLAQPGSSIGLGTVVFALFIAGMMGLLPWSAVCVAGFGLGLVPRRWLRPAAKAVAPMPANDWRPIHVGVANDALAFGHIELWKQPWRPTSFPPVRLPHPSNPNQMHDFKIFDVGERFQSHRFAAAELSNGVWGFYVPSSGAVPEEECLSADGSLRYIRRLVGPPAFNSSQLTLSDTATGVVYFDSDGHHLEYSGFFEQCDGRLSLQVAQYHSSAVIRIDPIARVFRLDREEPDGRPLAMLDGAIGEALYGKLEGFDEPWSPSAKKPLPLYCVVLIALWVFIAIGAVNYLVEQRQSGLMPFTPTATPPFMPLPTTPTIPGPSGNKR